MSELFVHEYGNRAGPDLLALHGVSAHGRRFLPMSGAAFPHARVIAPDLRGHGRSPAGSPATIERHVEDLIGVLDDRGIETVAVVGHSFGACLGVHLLAAAPERVRLLVLLDPAMAQPEQTVSALRDGMLALDGPSPTLAALIETRRAGRVESAIAHCDADVTLAAVNGPDGWRTPWDRSVVAAAWREMARPMPTLPVARPTLLLDATKAGFVTDIQRNYLRSELGDALTVEQFELGHMLYWEDFEAVSASVRAFLAAHCPSLVA